jgi:hypothetical protein
MGLTAIFARHGESRTNVERVFANRVGYPPDLTEASRSQAQAFSLSEYPEGARIRLRHDSGRDLGWGGVALSALGRCADSGVTSELEPAMKWVAVESSLLVVAAYESDTESLWLRFQNGRTYKYWEVPEEVYADLLDAQSNGQ